MILTVDIGNTNIVVGAFKKDQLLFVERISTDIIKTELEYVVVLRSIMDIYKLKAGEFSGAIISSVVPPLNRIWIRAIEKFLNITPIIVGPGVKTGMSIHMEDPGSIGADLIVNAVSGLVRYGEGLIIIDMGTATTISVIDEKKNYIGGIIMPGVRASLDSLVNKTSQLPRISLDAPTKVIGKNTVDCMKSGIIIGQAATLDGMIDRMWDELGYQTKIVATGGLASRIIPYCKHDITVDEDLTLEGLKIIYDKNCKK